VQVDAPNAPLKPSTARVTLVSVVTVWSFSNRQSFLMMVPGAPKNELQKPFGKMPNAELPSRDRMAVRMLADTPARYALSGRMHVFAAFAKGVHWWFAASTWPYEASTYPFSESVRSKPTRLYAVLRFTSGYSERFL